MEKPHLPMRLFYEKNRLRKKSGAGIFFNYFTGEALRRVTSW